MVFSFANLGNEKGKQKSLTLALSPLMVGPLGT